MFREAMLEGKTILITGGGTGLGRAMGTRFLELGANLIITGRRKEILEQAAAEMCHEDKRILALPCDVKDVHAVDDVIEAALERFGQIDVLINNAAANFISPTEKLTHNAFKLVADTVLMGSVHTTLSLGKHWIKQQQPATVLNMLTTYAATGSGFVVPSACAKAGLEAMTKSLAFEWAKYKIRFVGIAPGPFPTDGAFDRIIPKADIGKEAEALDPKNHPWQRFGRHDELADLAAFLISDQAEYINGEIVRIDGGLTVAGSGEFNRLKDITPQQWKLIRKQTRFSDSVRK